MTTVEPPTVKHFVLKAVPPGVAASAMLLRIDAATGERLVDAVISQMKENYVFAETAKKVEAALRVRQKAGAYNEADAGHKLPVFRTAETETIDMICHVARRMPYFNQRCL